MKPIRNEANSRLILNPLPLMMLTFCIASLVLVTTARNTHFTSQGRIGFVSDTAYFELEPIRNLLITRTVSQQFKSELIDDGADPAVEISGEEAYRPLAYFEVTGRGPEANAVRTAVDLSLVNLADWLNDQRAASGIDGTERAQMIVVRPASEPDRRSPVAWALAGAASIAGLAGAASVVARSKRRDSSGEEDGGANSVRHSLALLCAMAVLAMIATLDLDTLLVGWWQLPAPWFVGLLVSIALAVVYITYDGGRFHGAFTFESPAALLLLVPVSGLVLAPIADDPTRSIVGAIAALSVGGALVLIASVHPMDRIAKALLVAAVIQLLISVPVERWGPATDLGLFHAQDLGLSDLGRYRGVFADPNEMGRAGLVALLLVPIAKIRSTAVALGIGTLAAGSVLASQSRTALIASVVAMGVGLAVSHRWRPKRSYTIGLVAAAGVFAAFAGGFINRVFGSVDNGAPVWSFSGRTSIWQASVELFMTHPLFGVGFDNGPTAFAEARRLGLIDNPVDHAHNVPLQIALTGGLVALVVFAAALWVGSRRARGALSPAGWALLAGLLTLGLTEPIFASRPGWFDVAIWLLLASLLARASVNERIVVTVPDVSGQVQ